MDSGDYVDGGAGTDASPELSGSPCRDHDWGFNQAKERSRSGWATNSLTCKKECGIVYRIQSPESRVLDTNARLRG